MEYAAKSASFKMRRIIVNDATTMSRKRSAPHRACEKCRKGKRRCVHDPSLQDVSSPDFIGAFSKSQSTIRTGAVTPPRDEGTQEVLESGVHSNSASTPFSPQRFEYPHNICSESGLRVGSVELRTAHHKDQPEQSSAHPTTSENKSSPARFIGDLNPESVFHAATSPGLATRTSHGGESIGTWLSSAHKEDKTSQITQDRAVAPGVFYMASPELQRLIIPALEEQALSLLPPEPHLSRLIDCYSSKVHSLLPLIDMKLLEGDQALPNSKILIVQATCLLASMNPAVRGSLYLRTATCLLDPRDFGCQLLSAMRCNIELGTTRDKTVLTQALGAMSLFTDGPDGPEMSTSFCAKMVQLSYSTGLHLQRTKNDGETQRGTLFCCVWALDRFNAAINGRPIMIHQQDVGRNLEQLFHSQTSAFRTLLDMLLLLDQVIALYRPNVSAIQMEIEVNFPSFEDVLIQSNSTNLIEEQLGKPLIQFSCHGPADL